MVFSMAMSLLVPSCEMAVYLLLRVICCRVSSVSPAFVCVVLGVIVGWFG